MAIFLYHMEIISGVYPTLEQYPRTCHSVESRFGDLGQTDVFAAYLKNSVTRFVEPLRVMACRVGACFVGGMSVDE